MTNEQFYKARIEDLTAELNAMKKRALMAEGKIYTLDMLQLGIIGPSLIAAGWSHDHDACVFQKQ